MSEIERHFWLNTDTQMFHYRDESRQPFSAELLENECRRLLELAFDKLATSLSKAGITS